MKVLAKKKLSKEIVKFEDVQTGECFRFADEYEDSDDKAELCMKTDCDQDAVALATGQYYCDLCGENVIVFEAEIHVGE